MTPPCLIIGESLIFFVIPITSNPSLLQSTGNECPLKITVRLMQRPNQLKCGCILRNGPTGLQPPTSIVDVLRSDGLFGPPQLCSTFSDSLFYYNSVSCFIQLYVVFTFLFLFPLALLCIVSWYFHSLKKFLSRPKKWYVWYQKMWLNFLIKGQQSQQSH